MARMLRNTIAEPTKGKGRAVRVWTTAYKRVAGREILADVYRPEGDGRRPVVVWIHGGGLVALSCGMECSRDVDVPMGIDHRPGFSDADALLLHVAVREACPLIGPFRHADRGRAEWA
jgi:hypothetical protein